MKPNKIGIIFLVSVLTLAGIGISYAGWTDSINVSGTVQTGYVQYTVTEYSGTWVWKIIATHVKVEHSGPVAATDLNGDTKLNDDPTGYYDLSQPGGIAAGYQLVAYSYAHNTAIEANEHVYFEFVNLFPCIDFKADFKFTIGTIPVILTGTDLNWINQKINNQVATWIPSIPGHTGPTITVTIKDQAGNTIYPGTPPIQLHPGVTYTWELLIHIPQDNDYMNAYAEGSCTLNIVQWSDQCQQQPTTLSRTYTLDTDFDEGTLFNVNHEVVHDQLQLNEQLVSLPFMWVPNDEEPNAYSVSKLDTNTGNELGRYRTVPPNVNGRPSRTTVDTDGSCWVANRYAGTVVKIGLAEADKYIDRNGNGAMDTSQDSNNDHDITGAEMLAWGADECVLFEVVLIPGSEGTYAPGAYQGSYTNDWTYPGPRSVAVDANNNAWVGCYGSQKFYYIRGTDGAILNTVDVSSYGHTPYGAVIDSNGVLWSASLYTGHVLRLNPNSPYSPAAPDITTIYLGHTTYGLGLDNLDHLFVAGWESSKLSRININTATVDWTKPGPYGGRGVVCTSDNNVWVASSYGNSVYRYDNDGNQIITIGVGNHPTGVALDSNGKIWVCHLNDDTIKRIDPASNSVDLTKTVVGSSGHYTYGDMTGVISGTITTKTGTWTVVWDTGYSNVNFDTISWTGIEPVGTSITVKVQSSIDGTTWSAWTPVTNGGNPGLSGGYLKIEVKFQIVSGDVSPILYDLTVGATIL